MFCKLLYKLEKSKECRILSSDRELCIFDASFDSVYENMNKSINYVTRLVERSTLMCLKKRIKWIENGVMCMCMYDIMLCVLYV